jgi:hypothetical protein
LGDPELHIQRRASSNDGQLGSFAGKSGRAKESRIEGLAGRHAVRSANAKEKPAGLSVRPGTMIEEKKSTDPGLSAAERKTLRGREAQEAVADHEAA